MRKMHPRNPYRIPLDYTDLAIKYPKFRQIGLMEQNGSVSIDMKSKGALEIMTKHLLFHDFKLNICLPEGHLIPTIPSRLNYILWLEDIISILPKNNQPVWGIDIGSGASCIYSLLSSKKNAWQMIALEVNSVNSQFAEMNIERNNLSNSVQVFKQTDKSIIFKEFFETDDLGRTLTFCMCNPPFFASKVMLNADIRNEKKLSRAVNTGIDDELSCEGGEVAFIRNIINESLIFKDRIRLFTTMIGQKTSLPSVFNILQNCGIDNCIQTEFRQGNVTRWVIAWTFERDIHLHRVPFSKPICCGPDTMFTFCFKVSRNFHDCLQHLYKIFADIQLKVENISETKSTISLRASAYNNTWSNRREQRILNKSLECNVICNEPILIFNLEMTHKNDTQEMSLYVTFLCGSNGKNGLYELFQFLKNQCKIL